MKKPLLTLFYLIAFIAVSYFLREYLNAPKSFIISLIISLGVILFLVSQKSKYTKFVGVTLIVAHFIWIIGYFIPVYEKTPDIRQRYRKATNTIAAIAGSSTGTIVALEANGQLIRGPLSDFTNPRPVYQGNRVSTAAASVASDGRLLVRLWDGSSVQLFPQTTIALETLATDFSALS
ncbi:hypothetical protein KBC03_05515 [Patescibacteria group bacterium]|nr:hypothetical protein [Patescibacteria group bacterium]